MCNICITSVTLRSFTIKVESLHITHNYSGLLACNNICQFNERLLQNLPKHIISMIPSHIPLHTIIPSSAPERLPPYLLVVLLDGEIEGRDDHSLHDENGDEYNGFWLGVAMFIEEINAQNIDEALKEAKSYFNQKAKGYFF